MSEEEKMRQDDMSYGDLIAFKDKSDIIQGETKGWRFRRGGGLMVKRGWQWMGSRTAPVAHWRLYDINYYKDNNVMTKNASKMPLTHYYWMGSSIPEPIPWNPRELRKYEFFILKESGSGFPTWIPSPLGDHKDAIETHNREVEDWYSTAIKEGGKRRKTRRRRRQSKRFLKTKK